MLRTRRRDNNVKPNRRLDRKSSRGMLYENEELRLKTININAEIERGQSDIKKLKRENEMLKKEIWCLRDEYDKLDKLLKDKKIDFSSSSTTYSSSSDSESESCSSCTEDAQEVETSQNLINVQNQNLQNMHHQFDHLSVVTEETSCENSDKNSIHNRNSINKENCDNILWGYNQTETEDKNVIQPDQSYPVFNNLKHSKSQTLPNQMPGNFFAPIQTSKSFDNCCYNQQHQDQSIFPGDYYAPTGTPMDQELPSITQTIPTDYQNQQIYPSNRTDDFLSKKIVHTNATNFYQNMILVPKNPNPPMEMTAMEKKASDLIVKIDNQNFNNKSLTYSNTTPSTTFSNGGNLEELLHDIESISQDILKLTNLQRGLSHNVQALHHPGQDLPPAPHLPAQMGPDFYADVQGRDMTYVQSPIMDHLMAENMNAMQGRISPNDRTHKSELNVVLMPKAMPLIGFDKYRNIHRSFESINSKNIEDMSASQQNLSIIPPDQETPKEILLNVPPTTCIVEKSPVDNHETNPFFFGNLKDNYVNADYFNMRYNPDHFVDGKDDGQNKEGIVKDGKNSGSKSNLLETPNADRLNSENEENLKFKTSKSATDQNTEKKSNETTNKTEPTSVKSPKLSIRRKVSIHFKGKKDKEKIKKTSDNNSSTPETKSSSAKVQSSHEEKSKKHSIFDIKFTNKDDKESKTKNSDKAKNSMHQKTPSIESKKSTTETSNFEPKTPTSSDSKNSDKKNAGVCIENRKENASERAKSRKSNSVSPDRNRHVHLKDEASTSKKHKKHKRSDRSTRTRRPSTDQRLRERSFSICTDRSNMLDARYAGLGLGYSGGFLYDDFSDRERSNSASSCDSHDSRRKMSTISNVHLNGKLPWCGCWGNGCL